jgi:hypothetical protein
MESHSSRPFLYFKSKGSETGILGCTAYVFFPTVCEIVDAEFPSETRHTQQCSLKVSPVQTSYAPDGRSLLYASAGHQLFFMTLGRENDGAKEQWSSSNKDAVRAGHFDAVT